MRKNSLCRRFSKHWPLPRACLAGLAVFAVTLVAGLPFCFPRAVRLEVRFRAPVPGGIQVYYRTMPEEVFAESRLIVVQPGVFPSVANIAIPARQLYGLRIDFGSAPGDVSVLGGSIGDIQLPPWKHWSFSPDVTLKSDVGESGELKLFSDRIDPYMAVAFRRPIPSRRTFNRQRFALLLSILFAIICAFWRQPQDVCPRRNSKGCDGEQPRRGDDFAGTYQEGRVMSVVNEFLDRNGKFIVFALVCALVAWGYELFSYTISIDDELHLHDTALQLAAHSTMQGRWGAGLFSLLLGNTCGVPVVPMMGSLLGISVAFCILGRIMRFGADEQFLFFPLFIACPIWYYLFSFWMVSPNVGIYLLLTAVGFLGFMQRRLWIKLVSLAPCALAAGGYEISIALLPMFCSAYILNDVVSVVDGGPQGERSVGKWLEYLALLLKMFVFMLACVALYIGIGKVVRHICGMQLIYTSGMFSSPGSWADVPNRIRTVKDLAASCYNGTWFLPSPAAQGHSLVHSALVSLSLLTVAIGILKGKKGAFLKLIAMGCLFFIVFAPFMLRFLTIVLPPRSCMLIAFGLVIILSLAWKILRDNRFFRFVYLALMFVVSIQYLLIVNRLAYASKMQSDLDCEVVRKVVERLEADPSFFPYTLCAKECPFIMVGAPNFVRDDRWPQRDTVGQSILDWCGGHPTRFAHLTRLLTRRMLARPDQPTIKKLSAVVDDMPLWPLPGSAVMTNGVAIVKFASEFSPIQMSFYNLE